MQAKQVEERLGDVLGGEKLDGIFCVAGGWAGGNAASKGKVTPTLKTLYIFDVKMLVTHPPFPIFF